MYQVFKCDYCDFMGSENEVKAHEEDCLENYNNRGCFTCKHKCSKDLYFFKCDAGREIPKGQYFEHCNEYERKESPDWSGKINDIFGSMFGGV